MALGEGSVPSTFEIGQSSRSVSEQYRVEETPTPRIPVRTTWIDLKDDTPVSPSSPVVPSPIASSVATPSTIISVDEDQFLEDIQRENHDLRRQLAEERRERLELTDRIARIERRQEFGGE
ncbi:hypothetical protein Tco_1197483 [Tanacetum coccineum]